MKPDPALRAAIEREIKADGLDAVFKTLVALDPEAAYVVDPKNPRRVVRALEVARTTGAPFTKQRTKREPLFDALEINLDPPRAVLRKRIDERVDTMMQAGLLEEVRRLVEKYGADCQAFDAIGYREPIDVLNNRTTPVEAAALIKLNTWHFAKRQIAWFKKDKGARGMERPEDASALVKGWFRS